MSDMGKEVRKLVRDGVVDPAVADEFAAQVTQDLADMAEPDSVEYELSSSPVFALCRPVTLLVGLEEQSDGKVRAYLGARWRGIYLLLDDEEAQPFRAAWGSGQHVWMSPVPPPEMLHREVDAEALMDLVDDTLDEDNRKFYGGGG